MKEPQKFYWPLVGGAGNLKVLARHDGGRDERSLFLGCVRSGNEISFGRSRNAVAGFMALRAGVIACLPRGKRRAGVISFTFAAHAILRFFARASVTTAMPGRSSRGTIRKRREGGADREPRYQSAYR